MSTIGIDIGASAIKAVRLEPASSEGRRESRVALKDQAERTLSDSIRTACRSVGLADGDTLGVCLPGLADPGTGVVIHASNLPQLVGLDPRALVAESVGIAPERVMTDAAAWGAGVWNREPVQGRLLVLAMGTGIGGAFMVDGKPATLDGLSPGHIGALDVSLGEDDTPVACDGAVGVLEAYAGGRALIARFGIENLKEHMMGLPPDDPALRALTKGIRICHAIYKPDAIRLVGGIGAMLEPHCSTIDRTVRTGLTGVARPGWTLKIVDDLYLAAEGVALASRVD